MNAEHPPTEVRPWGDFLVLIESPGYKVKRLQVNPGQRLSLQSHRRRSEHWVVVSGVARVTVGDRVTIHEPNSHVFIPGGSRHRLENAGESVLTVVEVQYGDYLGEDDIERYDDDYSRCPAK